LRSRPTWKWCRTTSPYASRSRDEPFESDLAESDEIVAWLLGLSDEEWEIVRGDSWIRRDGGDGPVLTGDPEIDKLERELWERTREKQDKGENKGRRRG
jgi:hypothetical protein